MYFIYILIFSGDIDIHCDSTKIIPKNTHFHPEGLILNINECFKCGYGFTFHNIWNDKCSFKTHNIASPEALLGQYAEYCLSGNNILKNTYKLSDIYKEKVKIRNYRTYHGEFDDGLVNMKTIQR